MILGLYTNRLIQLIADGLLGVFMPVFLLQAFGSINKTLIFYLAIFVFYTLLAAPGAMLASRISFKNALTLSVLGGTGWYVLLILFEQGRLDIFLFGTLAVGFLLFDKILYWIPYHSGLGKFLNKANSGRSIGWLGAAHSLISSILPIIAGLVIANYGFGYLFTAALIIYFSSIIPLILLPPINEYYSFSYWQTWKVLLHKRDRRILLAYMADGFQDFIGGVIWPIFIWQTLNGNFQFVGAVSSLIIVTTIILKLLMGNYTDKFDKKKLLQYGTILYSFGWLAKAFVQTGFHIFISSSYHNFSLIAMRTPLDALMYEKAADSGHYIDEYTVLRQMALNLGRIIAVVVLLGLFSVAGFQYAFILAAVVALFVNLI